MVKVLKMALSSFRRILSYHFDTVYYRITSALGLATLAATCDRELSPRRGRAGNCTNACQALWSTSEALRGRGKR
jgi:hypothetical protein